MRKPAVVVTFVAVVIFAALGVVGASLPAVDLGCGNWRPPEWAEQCHPYTVKGWSLGRQMWNYYTTFPLGS